MTRSKIKLNLFSGILFLCAVLPAFTQEDQVTLNRAINNAMTYLETRLPAQSKVAVLNYHAPTGELSDYVIEELTTHIVNSAALTVVDRRNLELLEQEMNFQMSGEVSDDTALAIGQKVGAQIIISGSINSLGDTYRMRVRAIKVETAEVLGQHTATIRMDATLAALLRIQYDDSGFSTGRKIGAGFLNTLMGAGSFSMGDWQGGLIFAGGDSLAAGLLIWDVPGFTAEDPGAGVPGGIGFALIGITAAYGFVRPFFYHKPAPKNAFAGTMPGLNVVILPDNRGIKTVQVSYTLQF
jgi:TolB-like protein